MKNKNKNSSKTLSVLLALTSGLLMSQSASAWNECGHKSVAYLAYKNLDSTKKERVRQLLSLNNDFAANWTISVPANLDKDAVAFSRAANWADDIKDRYSKDSKDAPDANIDMLTDDHFEHRNWHFINLMFSEDSTPLPPMPSPNAKTQINRCIEVLSSDASDTSKSYCLVWLLHLVGDVHQPLHTVARVTAQQPEGDKGGNDVITTSGQKLHSFWDSSFGEEKEDKKILTRIDKLQWTKPPEADDLTPESWISESEAIAKTFVYKDLVLKRNGKYQITQAYKKLSAQIASDRVKLAGFRLAAVINNNLK